MGLVTVFIAVAIILGIAVAILGETGSSFDCNSLQGSDGTDGLTSADKGWAKACYDVQDTSQDSFGLLVVLLVVISAVAILTVVRLLY